MVTTAVKWSSIQELNKESQRMGIFLVGDLSKVDLKILETRFGIMGNQLYHHTWSHNGSAALSLWPDSSFMCGLIYKSRYCCRTLEIAGKSQKVTLCIFIQYPFY